MFKIIDYLKNILIFSFRVNCPEHDCSSHDMTTHFRRGQSKVYYASEVWDPGEDEEFARTSFRSDCSAGSEQDRGGGQQLHHTVSQNIKKVQYIGRYPVAPFTTVL